MKTTASTSFVPSLKSIGVLLIVISAISPASSVFVIMPLVIAKAGSGAIWSYLFAAVTSMFMAFVYAELSSAFPTSGGEYPVIGRTMNRYWGFITLVMTVFGSIWVIATMSLGISAYLGALGIDLNVQWTAVVMLVLAAAVAVLNIKVNAFVTGLFLLIEILALVLLTALGFIHVERPFIELMTSPQIVDATFQGLTPATFGLFMGATSLALFSYEGYGSAIYLGEETHDAKRKIGRVVLIALGVSVLTQIVPLLAVLMGAPNLVDLMSSPQMMSYFIESRAGKLIATIVSLSIATAIFNAVIAMILQSARLVYSTGRDNTWFPSLNTALATIHPRFNSPFNATILLSIASCIACFMKLETLMLLSGTMVIVVHSLLCIAVILGRRNGTTDNGFSRMPFFPIPAVLCLAGMAAIFYLNLIDADFGRPSLISTGEIILCASIYYFLFLSRRKNWNFHLPD